MLLDGFFLLFLSYSPHGSEHDFLILTSRLYIMKPDVLYFILIQPCFFFFSREMALNGLFPGKDDTENVHLEYPKLGDMLDFIVKHQPKLLDSTEHRDTNLLFPSKTYVVMLKFLLRCFEAEFRKENFSNAESKFLSSVGTFSSLLEHAMAFEGSIELHSDASKALVAVASRLPEVMLRFR